MTDFGNQPEHEIEVTPAMIEAGAIRPNLPCSAEEERKIGNPAAGDKAAELAGSIDRTASPSALLYELSTKHPDLRSTPVPKVILQVAEEMTYGIEHPGIALYELEEVLRVALYLDRHLCRR